MQISSYFRSLKTYLPPTLFSLAALGTLAVHYSSAPAGLTGKPSAPLQAVALGGDLKPLAAALRKGDIVAKLEFAKRYSSGQGVARDEAGAFQLFRGIADQYSDIDPRDRRAPLVSEAFRNLAQFYRRGVAELAIKADPAYAFSLLHYAASYFGDPQSQFELAKLILDGEGGAKSPRIAAQWLLNASRKGYPPAQALLGNLLWRGEGVKRVAGDGLGLLAVARWNAAPEDKPWVSKLYEAALAQASTGDVFEANAFIAQEASAFHWTLASGILISGATQASARQLAANAPSGVANPASPSEGASKKSFMSRLRSHFARIRSNGGSQEAGRGERPADMATMGGGRAAMEQPAAGGAVSEVRLPLSGKTHDGQDNRASAPVLYSLRAGDGDIAAPALQGAQRQ